MLREPETFEAPSLAMLREIERVAKRLRSVRALRDRRKIEDGERNHVPTGCQCDLRRVVRVVLRMRFPQERRIRVVSARATQRRAKSSVAGFPGLGIDS